MSSLITPVRALAGGAIVSGAAVTGAAIGASGDDVVVVRPDPYGRPPGTPVEVPTTGPGFSGSSTDGNNSKITGSHDPTVGVWSADMEVNWGTDLAIEARVGSGQTQAYIRRGSEFTNLTLSPTGLGGRHGAYNGMHTVTRTATGIGYDGKPTTTTYTTVEPHSGSFEVVGDASSWSAEVDVNAGLDATISGRSDSNGWSLDVVRRGASDIHVEGDGPAPSLDQQVTTAIAYGVHR